MTMALIEQWHGAVSAGHGVGIHKRPYLLHSRGAEQITAMRAVKAALDPHGIVDPAKVF